MSSVSIDVDPDTFLVFRSDFCSATSVRIFVRNVSNDKAAIFKVMLLLNLFARYKVYKISILHAKGLQNLSHFYLDKGHLPT